MLSGKKLLGGRASISGNVSSQFISALILSAPYFENGIELTIENEIVSPTYIDMTIAVMNEFGSEINKTDNTIIVKPKPYTFDKNIYTIENDWSAASYFYSVAAGSTKKINITIPGLFKNSLQPDSLCATVFESFGIETRYDGNKIIIFNKEFSARDKFNFDFNNCPDIAQTLVCTCVALNRPFNFTGLRTLRVKETDRIEALKTEFNKAGIVLNVGADTISFDGNIDVALQKNWEISTYNDHRMAMTFAALCLKVNCVKINDADVVSKSFPEFWEQLKHAGIQISNFET